MSRRLTDLAPDVQELAHAFLALCEERGLDVLITCTYRSPEEQTALYRQGRDLPGRVVTWARAGESLHNRQTALGEPAARAFDVVPLRYGKPIWGTGGNGIDDDPTDDLTDDLELWERVGQAGKDVGLRWAGDWPKGKREYPHFERPEPPTIAA